jgi:predicted ATPase
VVSVPFVGRDQEVRFLRATLDSSRSGGAVVLLAGEAGAGKSRLADELSATVQKGGIRVLWGRCHDDAGAPVLWPWVQIIRAAMHALGRSTLAEDLGTGAGDVV